METRPTSYYGVGTGIGIALTMSPMSTAAMNAVHEDKAGIASGLLSMMRMVGGTFGVAATGAVFQAEVGPRLQEQAATASTAARDAFISGLTHSMRLSAAVALAGAILGCALIRARRDAPKPETSVATAAGGEITSAGQPAG